MFETLIRSGRGWPRELALATMLGLLLGMMGPFGSFMNRPQWVVVAYWVAALWLGAGVFGLAARGLQRWRLQGWVRISLVLLGAGLLLSVACRTMAYALWPEAIGHVGWAAWIGQTAVISLPVGLVQSWAAGIWAPALPKPVVAPRSLLDRLPAALGRDVLALQMEDHYVRVHTSRGSALVLLPLSQAIAELESVPGLRVHRSWWVARSAIVATVQDGRTVRLRLSNDLEVRVARASVAAVRQAGLMGAVNA